MASNEPEQAHLLKMQTETITAVETVPSETSVLPTLLQTELSGSSSNLQGRVQLVNMQSEPLTSMEKVLKEANSSPNHLQTESSGSSVEGTSSQSSSSVTPPSTEQPDTSKTTTFTQHSFKKKRFVYGEIDFERNKCAKFIKVNDARSNLLKKLAQAVLKECPKLQDKNLLLSITDDARSLDDTHSGTFKESLKKILPGTCLVTGGTTTGVTQLVGECVREFNDSVRLTDGECKAIGIVNWDRCTHRHIIKDKGVLGIDVDGSVFVVDFGGKRWTFNPAFLPQYSITAYKNVQTRRAKTNIVTDGSRPFKDGDIVKICSDLKTLKKLQGELWNDGMMQTLGKIGTVVSVEPNLDLNIRVCGAELPYLPHAVALLTPETLTCQLNIEIHDHKPMKNELVRDVLKDDKQNVHDKLCTAIENQKPIRVGIDYNGDIFVKDPMGNRMTITLDKRTDVIASSTYYLHDTPNTTVAESSSDQSFAVGNLVQICNNSRTYNETQDHEWRINFDRTYGKIGTVLEVLGVDANSLMINVCGVKDLYQSQDVALVSVECITSQLKNWFETHKPRDENDEMVQAVLKDNVSEVRKLLGRDKKDIGIFGIDDDGFLFVMDIPGKRTFNVVGGSISPPFVLGDIVQICSNETTLRDLQNGLWRTGMERTCGKFGTVLEVHTNIEMRIKVCGVEWWYRPQVVGLVSLEHLTRLLKGHFKSHQPEDTDDKLLKAVMLGDARSVGKELNSSLKAQVVFGLDDGELFGIDINGQRHAINVAGDFVSPTFKKGALVQICGDLTRLKNLQGNLWTDVMKETVHKLGVVRKVQTNNDLVLGNWKWRYRPYAVTEVILEDLTIELKEWVEKYMPENMNDEMHKAVLSDNVTKVRELLSGDKKYKGVIGIDETGSLFVNDIIGKRRTFNVYGDSIQPTFFKGDIIQIQNASIPLHGKIAIVVADGNSYVLITVCGTETTFKRQDTKLVPLKRLTCELKKWFDIYNRKSEDEMVKAVKSNDYSKVGKLLSQEMKGMTDQRECGIDTSGSLFVKDISGKRRKVILTDDSISPSFLVDDIVQICNYEDKLAKLPDDMKWSAGKIGTVVEVTNESYLKIKVGASTFSCSSRAVTVASIADLTKTFKVWLEDHRPSLEAKTFGKAVVLGNESLVREALTSAQKKQTNGVFGIGDDGEVYVTDISNRRQKLGKAEEKDDAISNRSPFIKTTRLGANGLGIDKGDLVRISNDQSLIVILQDNRIPVDTKKILGKFGTVLDVKHDNALLIEACGVTLHCSQHAVVQVDLKALTKRLKAWFDANWPKLEEFEIAVGDKQYETVGGLLSNAIKECGLHHRTYTSIRGNQLSQDNNSSEFHLDPNHGIFIIVDKAVIQSFGGEVEFRAQLHNLLASEMSTKRQIGDIESTSPESTDGKTLPANQETNSKTSQLKAPSNQSVSSETTEDDENTKESKPIYKIPAINIAANCRHETIQAVYRVSEYYTTTLIVNISVGDVISDIAEVFKEEKQEKISFHNMAEATATAQVCHDSTARDTWPWMSNTPKRISTETNEDYHSFLSGGMTNALCNGDVDHIKQFQKIDSNFVKMFLVTANDYQKITDLVDKKGILVNYREQLQCSPPPTKFQDMSVLQKIVRLLVTRPVYGTRKTFSDNIYWNVSHWAHANVTPDELKTMEASLPFWNYMFLWALLLGQQEVAKICLKKVERATAMTLIASDFVAYLSKHRQYTSQEDAMQSEWTDISNGIIDVSFSDDEKQTASMLLQKLPYWDNNSCMELIITSEKHDIIEHPACQKAFDSVWEMGLKGKKSSIKFALCIFFPLLAGLLQFSSSDSVNEKIRKFFTMSKTKFIYNMISYCAFLILFAYVLLFDLGDAVSTTQYVLLAWVVTMVLEEIRQIARQQLKYIKNGWNVLDILAIVLFSIGFGLRYTDRLNASRVVLAIDFVAFVLRLNHIFYVHNILGPKLRIISKMFQDLLYFLIIMAVFFVSYAISSYAILYPDSPFKWETVRQILRRPYWHLYGELFLEETEGLMDCTYDSVLWTNETYPRCPSETGKIVVPIMMGIYLLVANIMLLNLLIAMFSFTFNEIHKRSNSFWCVQRYDILKEYADRPVLCPPLNVFWLLHLLVKHWRCESVEIYAQFRVSLDDRKMEDIVEFEKAAVVKYLNSKQMKEVESTDGKIKDTNKKLQEVKKGLDSMQTQMKELAHREDEIKEELRKILQHLTRSSPGGPNTSH